MLHETLRSALRKGLNVYTKFFLAMDGIMRRFFTSLQKYFSFLAHPFTRPFTWRKGLLASGLASGLILILCSITLVIYIACVPPPPLWQGLSYSPIILDNKNTLIRIGLSADDKYRLRAQLQSIPQHVRQAVLLYEDRHFYSHPGVNPLAIVRAMASMLVGGRRMGASTIAMQVARLRYNLHTRSIQGKLQQMLRALQLTWHYGHDTVLEAYFTLAPYGGNIEGIDAAARIYFHQSTQTLTATQALALSLIPQNPQRRAFKSTDFGRLVFHPTLEKARNVLHTQWNKHYPQLPVSPKAPPLRIYTAAELPRIAPHLTTEFLQQYKNSLAESHIIHSSIASKNQILLKNNIQKYVAHNVFFGLQNAMAMLVHWPSMEVRALVGSADFDNALIHGQVDGTKARRSPGSTLKPFIYAMALEQGLIHPQTMLMDTPEHFGEYNPENFDKQFQGPLPAHEALRLSRNMPAISLAARLDPPLHTFLQRGHMGLKHEMRHYGLSLVLGGAEIRLRDLMALYAMLANNGIWQPLRFTTDAPYSETTPLLSPEAALATLSMLETPLEKGQSTHKNFPLRYKTGTSNGLRDAWTIGIVGPYVLGVWLGNFDNSSNPMLVGSRVATPLFRQIAAALREQEGFQDILAEKYNKSKLVRLEVCRDTGDVQTELCTEKTHTWFIPGRSPIKNSGIYRKIWIDPKSNLRLCGPEEGAKEVVWEFWPSHLYQLFSQAGFHKPTPPAFATPCPFLVEEPWNVSSLLIQNPQKNITYHKQSTANTTLTFSATSTAHAKSIFWFVNKEYVGSSTPSAPFFWPMRVGKHIVYALDDLGQSATIPLTVEP